MLINISFQLVCGDVPHPTKKEMQQWIETTLHHENSTHLIVNAHDNTIQLNVRLVTPSEMQSLNKTFRDKDNVTDILSFEFHAPDELKDGFIGDIVLCPDYINEHINDHHKNSTYHWAHLLVHGVLHLLGFEHDTDEDAEKMKKHELITLHSLHIPNPYEA